MPIAPHIAEQAETLARSHLVIQDLDEHIANNHLEPGEKLVFRLLRHNYVNDIRFDLRLKPVTEHAEECRKNPSLLYAFRNETGKVIGLWALMVMLSGIVYSILEHVLGVRGLIEALLP